MFAGCYEGNLSPKEIDEEKVHYNPMYRKLGGPKNHIKSKRAEKKEKKSLLIEQSIIQNCQISGLVSTVVQNYQEYYSTNSTNLVRTFIFSDHQLDHCNPPINPQNAKQKKQESFEKSNEKPSEDMSLKYNQLQSKYIGVLEQANHYLERELVKSRVNSQIENKVCQKEISAKKLRSELSELKNKLNNIDFSGIKKLAGLQQKSTVLNRNNVFSGANKQNSQTTSVFRQIRQKII